MKISSRFISVFTLVAAVGSAVAAVDTQFNTLGVYPYPRFDTSFQDGRSFQDILDARIPDQSLFPAYPGSNGTTMYCFDPDFPPSAEVMAQINRLMEGSAYNPRYVAFRRWSSGSIGQPINLRWSFVPDTTVVGEEGAPGGAGPSNLFSTMDTRFVSQGGRATWIAQFQSVFNRWQAITGANYTRVTSGTNDWDDGAFWGTEGSSTRGDIRIGMKNIDGVNGILAYNNLPDSGDMVMDSSENWSASGNTYRFLRNTVSHELGHGMGFLHSCPNSNTKLMEPSLSTSFDGPQQDDIRGGQEFYGDINEPNDSSGQFTDLGAIAPGAIVNLGTVPSPTPANAATLSIHSSGDQDWYRFTLDGPRLINATLTPVGSTYLALLQNQNGSCQTTGASDNALAAGNLSLEFRSSNGAVIFRTVNTTAAGVAESTTGLLIGPAGNAYVKVAQTGGITGTQLYRLSITVQNVALSLTASDGTFNDFVRITWPNTISDATGYQVFRSTTNSNLTASSVATLAGNVLTFDDTTAVPGTTYYYFVRAQQPGSAGYRYTTTNGNAGFRPIVNTPPVANAGPDQTLTDTDRDGQEVVTLDGSASTDAQAPVSNYLWKEGVTNLANGPSSTANVPFTVGTHSVLLTVTDSGGLTATDSVTITVNAFCFADYNLDGGVDGGDVDSFFTDWASGISLADANSDGGVDGADIEAFFLVWAAGGC